MGLLGEKAVALGQQDSKRTNLPQLVEIEKVLEEIWAPRPLYMLIGKLCFGNLVSSVQLVWLTFLVPEITVEYGLTNTQQSAIQGACFLGSILGATFFGHIADSYGRRSAYILALVIIALFGFLSSLGTGPVFVGICQGFIGFGSGGTVAPFVYLSESAPAGLRGKVCTAYEICWGFGSCLAVILCWLFLQGPGGWRFVSNLCALIVVCGLVWAISLPESPRWLISKGRYSEAVFALQKIAWDRNGPCLTAFGLASHETILGRNQHSTTLPVKHNNKSGNSSISGIFSIELRQRTLMLMLCWFGFMSGYYGCITIVPVIFKSSSHSINYWCIMFTATSESIFAFATTIFIEKSRRHCLLFSSSGATVCLIALGFLAGSTEYLHAMAVLAFIGRGLLCATGNSIWVATPEQFPTQLRASAGSYLFAVGRLSAVAAAGLVYSDFSLLQRCAGLGFCTLCTAVGALFIKETAGQILVDDDELPSLSLEIPSLVSCSSSSRYHQKSISRWWRLRSSWHQLMTATSRSTGTRSSYEYGSLGSSSVTNIINDANTTKFLGIEAGPYIDIQSETEMLQNFDTYQASQAILAA